MSTSIRETLARLEQTAVDLGDGAALDLIRAVRGPSANGGGGRVRLLVVGAPGAGHFAVVNLLLGRPGDGPLSTSALPEPPVPVLVQHGWDGAAEAEGADGLTVALTDRGLRALLTGSGAGGDTGAYARVRVRSDAELLRTCDVRIEGLAAGRPLAEWKPIVAAADYVLVVLKATAMLSEAERLFIREVLAAHVGLERVALVINRIDRVPPEERDSIVALARAFLGGFSAQCPVLEVSAAGDDALALTGFVRDDLLERGGRLKAAALRRAAGLCLAELAAAAERERRLLELDEAWLRGLLAESGADAERARRRIRRAQDRVDLFVGSALKERCLRDIEEFARALRTHLAAEAAAADPDTARRHLGGYVEALWETFLDGCAGRMRVELAAECRAIGEAVAADLTEALGDAGAAAGLGGDALLQGAGGLTPATGGVRAAVVPRRDGHDGSTLATGLRAGGLALAVLSGGAALPVGAALVLAGQGVRLAQRRSIEAAETGSLVEAAVAATHEVEHEVKRHLASEFDALAGRLKAAVAEAYEAALGGVRAAVEQVVGRSPDDLAARCAWLDAFGRKTLPELQGLLSPEAGDGTRPAGSAAVAGGMAEPVGA